MNKKERRWNEIVGLLNEQPALSVKTLANILSVSEMTIRRDLKYMQENDLIGSGREQLLPASIENEYSLPVERTKFYEEKNRIGKFATSLIDYGDVIFLDNGTTTGEMSKYIPENMNLTVFCYNYFLLTQLESKKDITIIFPGGYYHRADQMFECAEGNDLIKSHRANKLFLSASGVHEKLGITCAHNYEVMTKRAAISSSLTKILVVDSSKFGIIRTAFFASLSEIDVIVTDQGISREWVSIIKNAGIKLYTV